MYQADNPTICWPADLTHGILLCEDCFRDCTSLDPHEINCADCFGWVNHEGYCNCPDEAYDEDDNNYNDPDRYASDEPVPSSEPEAAEVTDDDPDVPMNSLLFRSLPNRPMRMVSFEQEIGLGGNYIAEQLHEQGFPATPDHMVEYHASRTHRARGLRPFVTVEEDTSVAAELVWSMMDLDTPKHAEQLQAGLEIIRTAIRKNRVRLDMRCGGHIHVDVPDYVPINAARLYYLGCYLEDTVFRLASANWKCHRTEIARENYSPPVRKGAVAVGDALIFAGMDRSWMNFQHLMNARSGRSCGCGASQYGLWDECSCPVQQCTVEFRVFNTTANPIKLRAYIALCIGMVQYARDHEVTPDKFPEFSWRGSAPELQVGKSIERLDFIMSQLPMEDADRKAIMYCVRQSSLKPCLEAQAKGKEN